MDQVGMGLGQKHVTIMPREWCFQGMKLRLGLSEWAHRDRGRQESGPIWLQGSLCWSPDAILSVEEGRGSLKCSRTENWEDKTGVSHCLEDGALRSKAVRTEGSPSICIHRRKVIGDWTEVKWDLRNARKWKRFWFSRRKHQFCFS